MNIQEYRAAGGIVQDEQGRVLLIERFVMRDGELSHEIRLPKGHVEAGESDAQAAVREVCEETGYCGISIVRDLGEGQTEFTWQDREVHIRRTEHYYLMRLADPQRDAPHFDNVHSEEALYRPRWVANLAEAEQALSFESERRFVRRALNQEPPEHSSKGGSVAP
jgi:8-oxo-dGTP pyrophosphatase MutT (NUDIX family)